MLNCELWICRSVEPVDLWSMWICGVCGSVEPVDPQSLWICRVCESMEPVDLQSLWIHGALWIRRAWDPRSMHFQALYANFAKKKKQKKRKITKKALFWKKKAPFRIKFLCIIIILSS